MLLKREALCYVPREGIRYEEGRWAIVSPLKETGRWSVRKLRES